MPTTPRPPGPSAERVAHNVQHLRHDQNLSLQGLSDRLTDLGQPISLGQLSKLERGHRRVDVDDLVALAVALGVSPSRLLLPETTGPEDVPLTPALRCSTDEAWRWAAGVAPLHRGKRLDLDRVQAFARQCAPHEAEDWTLTQIKEHQRVLAPFDRAANAALAAGVPEVTLRSLVGLQRAKLAIMEEGKRRER